MTFPTWLQYLRAIRERNRFERRGKRRRAVALKLGTLEDRTLPSTFIVTNTGDNGGVNPLPGAGTGTLRQAIVDADAAVTGTAAAPDLIQFNIATTDAGYNSGTGALTIQPLAALPTVTDTLVIDGYTEPGASPNTLTIGDNAVLNIVLDGSQAGAVDGLVVTAGNCTVSGLVIDNFAEGSGITLSGSGNDVVTGSFIGTDVTGESAAANNIGINSNSPGDMIGSAAPEDRNIISGNDSPLLDLADGGGVPYDVGIAPGNANRIEGNYIGTDKSGTSNLGNGTGILQGNSETIGGLTTTPGTGAGNLISGNIDFGIDRMGNQNLIAGNLIGTTANGLAPLGNGAGIHLWGNNNTIGGTTPGATNIISGNTGPGGAQGFDNAAIVIENVTSVSDASGSYNVVEGNFIGTDITGTTSLGPQTALTISGSDNTIGGTTAGARNIISGNENGIDVSNSSNAGPGFGNVIQGNYIGTDCSGTLAVPNNVDVVFTGGAYDNTIGGTVPGAGNLIANTIKDESDIILFGTRNNIIQGNLIGTDKTGTMGLGAGGAGIEMDGANDNTIGGTAWGAGNTIAFTGFQGVDVESGSGNSILGNSILDNGLNNHAVFANGAGIVLDIASANDNQTAPVLTSVSTSGSGTTISGTLQSVAGTTFRIELFANAGMDPSGYGQGQTYLGFTTVTTDASGNATFTAGVSTVVPRGYFISATATNQATGDTSEFSKDRVVISFLVTNTNDSGTGSLREAIYDANTLGYGTAANPDVIEFNLPANDPRHDYYRNDGVAGQVSLAGIAVTTATSDSQISDIDPDWAHSWWSIQPASELPTITDPVVVDGYSQPGATPNTNAMTDANPGDNAILRIELNGSFAASASGLSISSGNTTVQGIVVNDFGLYGINIGGSGNDTIQGDLVGTDVSGTLAEGNVSIGVLVESAGNTIGGLTAAARNVISANSLQAASSGFDFGGVDISGGIGNVVEGNFIGTDSTGARPLGNFGAGVMMSFGAANNTIGGTVPQACNIIAASMPFPGHGEGVMIWRDATDNLVEGDFIGTDVTGTRPLGNALVGVWLDVQAGDGNVIGGVGYLSGGKLAGAGNLISGNGGLGGIVLGYGNDSQVYGNFIGTDVTGSRPLPNQGEGIRTSGRNNIVGGTGGLGNVVSGNDVEGAGGILVDPSGSGTVIQDNLVGTDVSGTIVLGNGSSGIYDGAPETSILNNVVAGNNQIGPEQFQVKVAVLTPGPANVIVQGNHIGTDETGSLALGGGGGIDLFAVGGGVLVGGTSSGASNTIAFNGGYGVEVDSGTGNSILGNAIFSNAVQGIFLNAANNANNNQAAPTLTSGSAYSNGTSISGTLSSVANTTFRIEFFANQELDLAGNAEGQTFLGFAQVTTDASGYLVSSPDGSAVITNPGTANASFTVTNLAGIPAGEGYVTATATNESTGDSSQFSNYLAVPTTMQLTASASPAFFGQPVTLTATVSATFTGFGTPAGSVVFVDTTTGTNLGSAPLSGGVATLTTAALNTGTHVITATYSGNTTFLDSSATLSLTVSPSILILNPSASSSLSLSGNAGIATSGNVVVDSSSKTALTVGGNASLKAAAIRVVGGVTQNGNAALSPSASTGVTAVADPLAGLSGPSTSGLTNYGAINYTIGTHSLQPGVYTQVKLSATASVTLCPGLYVIEGGGLTVTGSASLTGSGVMIYNAGSNYPNPGGTFGGITLSGNGTVSLTASTTGAGGTDPGIVIFQSRANTRALGLSGNAAGGLTGTVYAPTAQLVLGGNAKLNSPLVVDELSVSGNGVSTQVIAGATGDNSGIPDTLLAGDLNVYVSDPSGLFTANEQARIQDAITTWDNLLAPYSVVITEVSDPSLANVVIDTASTSAAGSAADGVLGCYNDATSEITILQGWNWYGGSDPTQVGAGQYDFQTVVTHELGHALGLGGSDAANSPMNETLPAGVTRRLATTTDLNIPETPVGADPERAALPTASPGGQPVTAARPLQALSRVSAPPLMSSQGDFGAWSIRADVQQNRGSNQVAMGVDVSVGTTHLSLDMGTVAGNALPKAGENIDGPVVSTVDFEQALAARARPASIEQEDARSEPLMTPQVTPAAAADGALGDAVGRSVWMEGLDNDQEASTADACFADGALWPRSAVLETPLLAVILALSPAVLADWVEPDPRRELGARSVCN